MSSSLISNLSELLEKWPGVGPRTAIRFVFFLMRRPAEELEKLIAHLELIKNNIKICPQCQNFSLSAPCEICRDSRRDHSVICVMAEAADMLAMEKVGEYRGVYHILGGVVNMPAGITPEKLKIEELIARIKNAPGNVKEIILALNADIEGETTSLYLSRLLKPLEIKLTRLARGLPQGSDLQYADEVTLLNALQGRREI